MMLSARGCKEKIINGHRCSAKAHIPKQFSKYQNFPYIKNLLAPTATERICFLPFR